MNKKFLTTILFFLLLLVFGASLHRFLNDTKKDEKHSSETQTQLEEITKYKKELSNCNRKYQSEYEVALDEMNSLKIQEINANTISCYEDIAQTVINIFYKYKTEEMTASLNKFIEDAYKSNGDLYAYSNFCTPNCGLMWNALQSNAAEEDTYKFIRRMFVNIENNLKSN